MLASQDVLGHQRFFVLCTYIKHAVTEHRTAIQAVCTEVCIVVTGSNRLAKEKSVAVPYRPQCSNRDVGTSIQTQ